MSKQAREFDVIVWGATGFTGRLVAAYLNTRYGVGGPVKWAMAARSADKLKAVASEIGAGAAPQIIANASDPASLKELCARTRVVCTTVGPYQKYGMPLVEACVEGDTDYVDLSGEPPFMRATIDRFHARAGETGARIVHSCGFDSIPFDLGVYYTQKLARERFGVPAREIKGRVKAIKGAASGGTAASMVETVEASLADPGIRRLMRDPYSLAPDETANRPARQPSLRAVAFDEDAGAWTAPFIMADINTKNVHRSNLLTGYSYGQDFLYSELMLARSRMAATMTAYGLGGFMAALLVKPLRALITRFVLPKPGEGPSKEAREAGFYKALFIAKSAEGQSFTAEVTGDMDPGYGSTSKMLAEAAVCLAQDTSQEQAPGGIWTPAAAMGDALLKRMEENAGLTFKALD